MGFKVERIEPVRLHGPSALDGQELMSPYVWRPRAGGPLLMLVRVVPPPGSEDPVTGRIWLARCDDGEGLDFTAGAQPLIAPGDDGLDCGGCEDPTVVPTESACVVYYTGLDADGNGQMLYVSGPDIESVEKKGVALASSKTERNTKEATVERTDDGLWRLFYEYAREEHSRVGLAVSREPAGPWEEKDDPFCARPDHWDSWHLSTGPLLMTDPQKPVMFYNGADRQAEWGIGWIVLSADCDRVLARCDEPLISPPPHPTSGRDIAFAASVLEENGDIWLYFSRNDRSLHRALVRREMEAARA